MTNGSETLRASALVGFAVGVGFGVYQTFTLDPMITTAHDGVPYWMRVTHIHLLGLSLVVFLFSFVVDDLFSRHRRTVVWSTVVGQWGTPLTLYPLMAHEIVLFGPIHNLISVLMFVVSVVFAGAYLVRG